MTDPGAATAAAKQALRRSLLDARGACPPAERVRRDKARTDVILSRLLAVRPPAVAAYLSTDVEPSTRDVVSRLARERIAVWLPVLTGYFQADRRTPAWARFRGWDHLRAGPYGIPEPAGGQVVPALSDVSLILVPALAGTPAGDRLGRGGGWYDRVLATTAAHVLTVIPLNADEVLPELPVADHDRPVSAIATPSQWLACTTPPRTWQAGPVIRRRVIVRGRVQGVFFRAAAREEAGRLGVSGGARNLTDGGVEVLAEGEDAAVEEFLGWLHRGPEHARVDQVEVTEETPSGERGFTTA